MKQFFILAHTLPTYNGTTHFARTIFAISKENAIKEFFSHFGQLNSIDRIVEIK